MNNLSDSDSPKAQKKRKIQRYAKSNEPDFSTWSEDQRIKYQNAKSQLERENIIADVQRLKDEEINNQQILRQNSRADNNANNFQMEPFSSESSSSEEEGQVRERETRFDEKTVPIAKKSDQPEEDYEKTIKLVTLKRSQIEILLMKVYYNEVMEGAFVRIQEVGLKRYVLAQILAVVEGDKPYQLGDTMTHKLLKLQIPEIKEPKYRHITLVSNQKVESQEYVLWRKNCEAAGLSFPAKEQLNKKKVEIYRAFNDKPTDAEIEEKIIKTVDQWLSHPKPLIYFNDLPVYSNFLNHQLSVERQIYERVDEYITDLVDAQDQVLEAKDTEEVISYKRELRQRKQRIAFLTEQIEKIRTLSSKHQRQSSSVSKQKTESQTKVAAVVESQTQKQVKVQDNSLYMKQLDSEYFKELFDNTYARSEAVKGRFVQHHKVALDIDEIVDSFMEEI